MPILDEYYQKDKGFTLGGLNYSKLRNEIPVIIDEMQDSVIKTVTIQRLFLESAKQPVILAYNALLNFPQASPEV